MFKIELVGQDIFIEELYFEAEDTSGIKVFKKQKIKLSPDMILTRDHVQILKEILKENK